MLFCFLGRLAIDTDVWLENAWLPDQCKAVLQDCEQEELVHCTSFRLNVTRLFYLCAGRGKSITGTGHEFSGEGDSAGKLFRRAVIASLQR